MIFRFGRYRLDTRLLELHHDGTSVPIEPQVFDLLRMLIENRDRVISKDEIIDAVWGGRIISDSTLNSRVNALRRAVGDDGRRQDVIRTLPRRGFRFVQSVAFEDDVAAKSANDVVDRERENEEPSDDSIDDRKPSDRPSIAVLPFENLSDDPDQEYFSDGITEDIITALSRFPDLFVIARNSTFTYKGRAVKVQEIGRELAVANIVEGSVRKAGNRIRLTVQLIDAASGNHIWADRYDRELTDLFDVQDEIVEAIVGVIPGRIEAAFAGHLKRKPPGDMAAYECLLAAKAAFQRATREDNAEAQRLIFRAIELEPDYPAAWAWKACFQAQAFYLGFSDDPEAILQESLVAIETAYRLDENDVTCNRLMCEVRMKALRLPEAQRLHERAFKFNPNDVQIVAQRGELMTWLGQHEDAIAWIEKAMRLDPFATQRRAHLLGQALHAARRYDEALAAFDQVSSQRYGHLADMAACHARKGDESAAKELAAQVLQLKPDFSAESYVASLPYQISDDRDHHREGLRLAGLP